KGYFTFIEPEDLEKVNMLDCLWTLEENCPETGEVIKVRACGQIKRKKFYLHRYLTDAGKYDVVEHFNHHTLDNCRRRNLVNTNQSKNTANARRLGANGFLRGVERRGEMFGAQI